MIFKRWRNYLIVLIGLFLVLISLPGLKAQETTPEFTSIVFKEINNELVFTLEITLPIKYQFFTLENPNRLVLDLYNIDKISAQSIEGINKLNINNIRIGRFKPEITRVVFDFEGNIPEFSVTAAETNILVAFKKEPEKNISAKTSKPLTTDPKKEEPQKTSLEKKPHLAKAPPPKPKKITPQPEKNTFLEKSTTANKKALIFRVGGGLYYPNDTNYKTLYGDFSPLGGGSLGYLIPLTDKEELIISLGAEYISDKGQTSYTKEDISIKIIPSSLDITYLRKFSRLSPFIALGLDYTYFKETYPQEFPVDSTTGSNLGFHIELGLLIKTFDHFYVFPYYRMKSIKIKTNDISTDLGGHEFGVGLLYKLYFK